MAQITRPTKAASSTENYAANSVLTSAELDGDMEILKDGHNDHDTGTSKWQVVSAENGTNIPLIVNNSTGTQNIANFRDNGTNVLTVADGGATSATATGATSTALTATAANGGTGKALIANNGTSTGNIFEAQDNGTACVTIADGGGVTFTGQLLPALGSAGAPSYSFTGDTNTGIYSSTADTVNISAGNSSIAQFDTNGITLGTNKPVIPGAVSGTPAQHGLYREGVVKGWINFNGTGTIAINDSFNVTSITDNGTGDYLITWDRDFANANYAAVGAGSNANFVAVPSYNAGTTQINLVNDAGTLEDTTSISLIVIGDQ